MITACNTECNNNLETNLKSAFLISETNVFLLNRVNTKAHAAKCQPSVLSCLIKSQLKKTKSENKKNGFIIYNSSFILLRDSSVDKVITPWLEGLGVQIH